MYAATGSSAAPWASDAPRLDALRRLPRQLSVGHRPLPDFLVIGAQRGGTTTLYDLLGQHPLVRGSRTKEVHYFDLHHERGQQWYRSNFPFQKPGSEGTWITGEASPFYLFHPLAPERARAEVPSARVLAVLRNPVDRAFSHYQHERAKGREPLKFTEAIREEQARTGSGWRRALSGAPATDRSLRSYSYLARGRYAEQIRRWLEHFPADQLMIVRSEDLFADPHQVMAAVFGFLSIRPFPDLVARRLNERTYAPLDAGVRAELSDYFAEPNRELAELVGRDFGWA
jgi:Sulfotransferase domain